MAKVRVRKRGKTYSYAFEAGRTAAGRRRVIEKGGFASKDAAYVAGVEAFTDYRHGGIGIKSERITLADFSKIWLDYIKNEVREATFFNYQLNLNRHVLPALGGISLQELKPIDIERLMLSLKKEGLAKRTLQSILLVVSQMLKYAVYPAELIRENPAAFIKVPKAPTGIIHRTLITKERFKEVLHHFKNDTSMLVLVQLLYYTGARTGEVLGLMWQDIDFKNNTLRIQRQRKRNLSGHFEYIGNLKTKQSDRVIFMNAALVDVLKTEKKRQEKLSVVNALDDKKHCFSFSYDLPTKKHLTIVHPVCVKENGAFISRGTLINKLHSIGLNAHSFRHTQATMLAESGVPTKAIAGRLGHASINTTLAIYTHDTPEQQKAIADVIEQKEEPGYSVSDMLNFFDT